MQFFDSGVTCVTTLTWFATNSIVTANKIYYTMFRKHRAFETLCGIFSCSYDGNSSKSSQWRFFVLTLIEIRMFRKCQMHCVFKKKKRQRVYKIRLKCNNCQTTTAIWNKDMHFTKRKGVTNRRGSNTCRMKAEQMFLDTTNMWPYSLSRTKKEQYKPCLFRITEK